MTRVKIIVLPPGGKPVLAIDKETNKLLLYTITYNKKIRPGEYEEPADIVEIFKEIATRGHGNSRSNYNPNLVYQFLEAILLKDAPEEEKITQVMKYVRTATKK